jgi:hypothetical protein
MSRLSIYAGQQGALTSFEGRYPLVLAGAWRAPDGKVAVALASISNDALNVPLILDGKDYALAKRGRVYRLGARGRQIIGRFADRQLSVSVPLAAREACLIELGP